MPADGGAAIHLRLAAEQTRPFPKAQFRQEITEAFFQEKRTPFLLLELYWLGWTICAFVDEIVQFIHIANNSKNHKFNVEYLEIPLGAL